MKSNFIAWVFFFCYLSPFVCGEEKQANPTSNNQPTIIINNNFPSQAPSAPTPSLPSTSPPTPSAPAEIQGRMNAPDHPEVDNGFRLALGLGSGKIDSTSVFVPSMRADYRFADYFGVEVRGAYAHNHELALGLGKFQIPFKSRWIDFTPSTGVGIGFERIGETTFTGTQATLSAELELFHFLILRAEYALGVEGKIKPPSRRYIVYADTGSYGCTPNSYSVYSITPAKYEKRSVGLGFRASPRVTLGFQYGLSTLGGSRGEIYETLLSIQF